MMRALPLLGLLACTDYNLKKEADPPASADDTAADSAAPVDSGEPDETGIPTDTAVVDPPPSPEKIYANGPGALYAFDVASHSLTHIADFDDGTWPITDMTDIAIDLDGNMVGVTFSSLYEIDATTGRCTYKAWLDQQMNALTFLADGRLIGTGGSTIYEINRSTGALTVLAVSPYISSGDIVGLPDGMLYWSVQGGDDLVRVDPTTGSSTRLGSIGTGNVWGMAYEDGTLYGFTPDGAWLGINPTTAAREGGGSTGETLWGATTNPWYWD